MKFFDKIQAKLKDRQAEPITIAFIGDSVTQGCFECPTVNDGGIGSPYMTIRVLIVRACAKY